MSTCCIALGEPAPIRGSISKMKMDIQKKKWTVIRQKNVLTEAFNCIHAHVQRDRKTDRNISVYMRTD